MLGWEGGYLVVQMFSSFPSSLFHKISSFIFHIKFEKCIQMLDTKNYFPIYKPKTDVQAACFPTHQKFSNSDYLLLLFFPSTRDYFLSPSLQILDINITGVKSVLYSGSKKLITITRKENPLTSSKSPFQFQASKILIITVHKFIYPRTKTLSGFTIFSM